MLTARHVFAGETVGDLIAEVLTREPDLSLAPESIRSLLRQCLQRDRRKGLRDIGDAAFLMTQSQPVAQLAARRQNLLPWILAAAATLAACFFSLLWLRIPAISSHPLRFTLDVNGPTFFSPD